MRIYPINSTMLSSTNAKVCRQCHRTKPIRNFISKNNMGICIICSTCRENQMKRYYGNVFVGGCEDVDKKKRLQESLLLNSGRGSETQRNTTSIPSSISPSPSPTQQPSLPPSGSSYQVQIVSQSFSSEHTSVSDRAFPVPYSVWIPVKQFEAGSFGSEIYVAKLLHSPLKILTSDRMCKGSYAQVQPSYQPVESAYVSKSRAIDLSPVCNDSMQSYEAQV